MKFQKALLTGATGGLGEVLAEKLSQKQIPLILVGRNKEALKKLQIKCPLSSIVEADLAKDSTPVLNIIKKEKPDLIINNAGFGIYQAAFSTSLEDQIAILNVNAKALLEITLEGIKTLIQENKRGTILNVSSISSLLPSPLLSVYAASKAFVTSFSKSLNFECRNTGISVLVSMPGQIATTFASKAAHKPIKHKKGEAISIEKMANRLLKQIDQQKRVDIYDFRYKLVAILSHILPESFMAKQIEQSLCKRIKH